jgi:DNA helicase-2/ATP-dependent DNA helicase PcrA
MAKSKREFQADAVRTHSTSNRENALKPTEEQIEIYGRFQHTDGNLLINALAGGGKTTTMEGLVPYIKDPWLYLAFNKAVVDEAKERMPDGGEIRTFNSMGLKCWRDGNGKADTNPKKIQEILKYYLDSLRGTDRTEASDAYWDILGAINMARHLGYVPPGKFTHARRLCDVDQLNARIERPLTPFEQEIVDDILTIAIKASYAGAVDFEDQVYMPALFGGSFPRFPVILVDERQDLSPTNVALLDKLVKGRLVTVGDRWQSIYYFRGAEIDGMDKSKAKFNMTEMPLSYSFRCPEAIVRAVHWRVPHMKWIKPGGIYEVLSNLDSGSIPDGAAIICRNNAPLFRAAFALLSRKRSVSVAGSEIGPKIVRLLSKVGAPGDSSEDMMFKIDSWQDAQLEKTNAPATVLDTAECLKIFASWGNTCEQAIGYAKHILSQTGKIYLTTGHKAKGREWDTVYHLDSHLLGKDDQDLNLRYVITTRAARELYEIDSRELQW